MGIVLEAGFNFKKQIEDALVFALDQNQKEGSVAIESAAVSHIERNASAIIREAVIALERNEQRQTKKQNRSVLHTNSAHVSKRVAFPPFLERMQAHQQQNISDEAACCLASTIYREDYTKWLVLVTVEEGNNNTGPTTWTTPLGELVCHGPSEGTCKEALVAIAQRHSRRRCDNNDVVQKQQQVLYDNKNSNSNTNDVDVDAVTVVDKTVMFYAEEESYITNNSSNTMEFHWMMIWICWFTVIAFGLLVYRNQRRRRR